MGWDSQRCATFLIVWIPPKRSEGSPKLEDLPALASRAFQSPTAHVTAQKLASQIREGDVIWLVEAEALPWPLIHLHLNGRVAVEKIS